MYILCTWLQIHLQWVVLQGLLMPDRSDREMKPQKAWAYQHWQQRGAIHSYKAHCSKPANHSSPIRKPLLSPQAFFMWAKLRSPEKNIKLLKNINKICSMDLELIAYIDDEGIRLRLNGEPVSVFENLKTRNVKILEENCECIGVSVAW